MTTTPQTPEPLRKLAIWFVFSTFDPRMIEDKYKIAHIEMRPISNY